MSPDEIARQTNANFFRLFSKVPRPEADADSLQAGCTACGMTLTFTILGCGSSGGVPRPALGWGDCDPGNPKNRRRRTSLLVERRNGAGVTRVLVDTSPDLREQLLDAEVDWLDARALHPRARRPHPWHRRPARAVHRTAGGGSTSISTSRRRRRCARVSAIASRRRPAANIRRSSPSTGWRQARPSPSTARAARSRALPVLQEHGDIASLGFRFGGLAYSCDLSGLPPASLPALAGPRRLDRGRAALQAAPEPFQRRGRAHLDRADQAAPGDPDQPAFRPRLRGAAAPGCRRTWSRPMTGWA